MSRPMEHVRRLCLTVTSAVIAAAMLQAQGRGGGEWTTAGSDAQRTGWVRSDAQLTKAAVQKGEFKFLWKMSFENDARQLNSLTEPILLDRLIGYRGFKTLAFIGGSADRVFAVDTDLGRPYWMTSLNYSALTGGQPGSTWECPGGLIATPTRRSPLTQSAFGGGFGGRGGARAGSAVGEPGKGAAVLSQPSPARGNAQPAPAGRGGAPGTLAAGRGPTPIPFGGVDPLFAVGSDGFVHTLYVSNGENAEPAVPFLPPHTKPSSLIWIDGIIYASTSDGCGAVPNGVFAMDLTGKEKKPVVWKTGDVGIAGTTGPAFAADGTVYVALRRSSSRTAVADAGRPGSTSAVVALDPRTLEPKDWFSAPDADFNSSPIVLNSKGKELVAVSANDGRIYLLDAAALGGPDHKTPLSVTGKYTAPGAGRALATWEDQGTRWILAPAVGSSRGDVKFASAAPAPNGAIVAFKLVDQSGKLTLEPGWSSRDLMSPLAPIVVNGMVFAVSSGEYRSNEPQATAAQRAQRSIPALLYILDGTTGKELWNSGKTITSFARAGVSAGSGQVYVVTYDNRLYAFGIPMEH
jgi:hypothetical protein